MARTIKSPVEQWPGSVTLSEPLTLPQVAAYYKATREARELVRSANPELTHKVTQPAAAKNGRKPAAEIQEDQLSLWEYMNAVMPGVYACVESWDLQNFDAPTADLFPGQPRKAAAELGAWLVGEVRKLVTEAEEPAPKASSAPPTPPASANSAEIQPTDEEAKPTSS